MHLLWRSYVVIGAVLAMPALGCARSRGPARTVPSVAIAAPSPAPSASRMVTIPLAEFRADAIEIGDEPPPSVLIHVEPAVDLGHELPVALGARVSTIVEDTLHHTGYATRWPGRLPTARDLDLRGARAFVVVPTLTNLEITHHGSRVDIACTFVVRISPWSGTDGGERWEANQTASASASARTTSGPRDHQLRAGVQTCVESAVEHVATRQVVPFLGRVARSR